MNIETEKFREFLRKAADEVATWPRWKQSILGGLMEADERLNPTTGSRRFKVAHDTGDGWHLHEMDDAGNVFDEEELPWPDEWPDKVSASFLRQHGFTIVPDDLGGEVSPVPRVQESQSTGAPLVDERKNYGMTPLRWAVVPPDFYEPIAVFEYRDQAEDWQKRNYPSCRVLDCRCWLDTEGRMMFRVLRVPVVQGSDHGGAEGTKRRGED